MSGLGGFGGWINNPMGNLKSMLGLGDSKRPAIQGAPTVVSSGSGINRGVQIPGFKSTVTDEMIGKSRHANQAAWDQINAALAKSNEPQLPPMPGSSGGGGGSSALSALSLAAASTPYDRALKQLGLDYGNNRNQALLQGKRQDADLQELFKRLGNYTMGVMNTGRQDFIGTDASLRKNYDAVGQLINNSYKSGVGNTNDELKRLGIDAVAPAALSGLGRDALYLGNQNQIDKNNSVRNNNANSDVFKSLMREMIGSAAVEGTSQRGHAKQATADALSQLLQAYSKGKTDLAGKKADAMLQAKISNARSAASARSSRNPLADWLWKEKYKESKGIGSYGKNSSSTKTGKNGFDSAMALLAQEAGSDPKKLQDLRGELDFLSSDRFGNGTETPYEHLLNSWGQRQQYGQTSIDTLMQALAALNKKR